MDSYNIHTLCCSIIDHCNLNCAGCTHFAPLADKYIYPLDKFEKNIKQLSYITKGNIKVINIAGGEPLLNKDILEYIKIIRSYFPNNRLEIRTNGLLLNKMDPSFFAMVERLNCKIRMSLYFKSIKYKNLLYKDKQYFLCNYLSKEPNNESNQCSFYKSYDKCATQVDENGDFHYCLFSSVIKYYNKYFGTNIPSVKGLDYNNIFEDDFIEKSNNLYKIKRPFCYYCHKPIRKCWHFHIKKINYWDYNG